MTKKEFLKELTNSISQIEVMDSNIGDWFNSGFSEHIAEVALKTSLDLGMAPPELQGVYHDGRMLKRGFEDG